MTPAQYRAARRKIGTQKHVAQLLGVTPMTIRRREKPGATISPEAALAIRAIGNTEKEKL